MEEIISSLQSSMFWFSVIFSAVVAIVINWLFKKTPALLKNLPKSFNKCTRRKKAKNLKRIKSLRWKSWMLHRYIAQERSYFLVFIILCVFYLIIILLSPEFTSLFKANFPLAMFLTSPLYIIEVIWLSKNSSLDSLLEHAQKIIKK